jgi:iron complex outermembrane receptor protein
MNYANHRYLKRRIHDAIFQERFLMAAPRPYLAVLASSVAAMAIAASHPAAAQDAAQDQPAPVSSSSTAPDSAGDEIVVTGSRIRGVAPVGSQIVSVGRDQIDQSSAVTTAQLLQEVPQISNFGISESSRGQSGGAGNLTFVNSINIRGIAPYATLTLINGHRTVGQGTTGFAVDPNVIPTVALERVEIVADGASAIYGSDAIAGVANLILRRSFDGVQIGGRYGMADNYSERQINAIAGAHWSSGHFMLAYEYNGHGALNGRDRDYYTADLRSQGGSDFRVNTCNPGNIITGGVSYAIPEGGVTAANRAVLTPGTSNTCDIYKNQDLVPAVRRHSAVLSIDQDITDWLSLYGDGFAVKRNYEVALPAIASTLTVPSSNAFFVSPPGTSPASETVAYSFGNDYLPSRNGYGKTLNGTLGLRARLPAGWKLEVQGTHGWNQEYSHTNNLADAASLTAALKSSSAATAFNPFGGANSQAVLDTILTGVNNNKGTTVFTDLAANADGHLFALPGGDVRAVVGYEHQYMTVTQDQTRGSFTKPTYSHSRATRSVDSVYGELFVPIFDTGNARPGLRRLALDAALRYDRYSDVGHTTNPKIGVSYAPVDGFTFRGSYGTSFRAPGIAQIYGNTNTLYVRTYADPTCDCVTQGLVRSGGNLDLRPETARTWSFGLDIAPPSLRNLRASITYFDLDYENQVVNYLTDFTILGRESEFAGTGIITRDPSAALIAQQVAETGYTGVVPANLTLFVDGRSRNLGKTIARGFDLQASYSIPTQAVGSFSLSVDGTYFTTYKTAISSTSTLRDQLNTLFNPLRFRGRGRIGWNSDHGLDASATVFFVNGYVNPTTPAQHIPAQATVDLHFGVDLGKASGDPIARDLNFGIDIRNLFDKDPQFVNIASGESSPGGYDPTLGDPIGRLVSVSLSKRF